MSKSKDWLASTIMDHALECGWPVCGTFASEKMAAYLRRAMEERLSGTRLHVVSDPKHRSPCCWIAGRKSAGRDLGLDAPAAAAAHLVTAPVRIGPDIWGEISYHADTRAHRRECWTCRLAR